jgi:Domain of Unknown Function with PDB structure (DUF3857)
MNPTHRCVFSFAVLCFLLLSSAHVARATVGWLPIPPEDLALKDNPKQPGADAMILYRELIDDASKAGSSGDTLEEYERMKIFTQEGTKYGHIEIPFSKGYQTVVYISGRTIKPDGTIVKFDGQVLESTAVKSSGLTVFVKTFTLPDVQPGCIIEYKYQLAGQAGWVHSHEWIVSEQIYTREAQFSYVPNTSYMNGLRPMSSTYLLPADAALKEQSNGSYLMVVHDVPGVVPEPLMPPERPMEARVEFYYQNPDAPAATDSSEHFWNSYAKKWDGELEHFIDKKNALNDELSKIVSPGDNDEVKLRKIYVRVQQIRNLNLEDSKMRQENKDENLKPNSNVEDVLKHGYAYGREINYLFVGLARAAGFDASETWVAPRNVDLFLPKRNDVEEISDELTWVRAGSKEYYLDPAARFFPFGLLPWYETETGGIRVDKHGATIINTPEPVSSDATIVRNADLQVKEDGSISGTIQVDYTGQRAALIREERHREDDTARTKGLEDAVKSWLPAGADFKITKLANWDDNEKPLHVEGTLTIPSFASTAARRMLMPIETFEPAQTASFAIEKRVNPVYFHFPYEEIDDIRFHMPAGFKAESVPPDHNLNLGAVAYQISAVAQNDTVEVKRHLVEKGLIFSKDDYPTLRKFFGLVKTNDDAQMVLENTASAANR